MFSTDLMPDDFFAYERWSSAGHEMCISKITFRSAYISLLKKLFIDCEEAVIMILSNSADYDHHHCELLNFCKSNGWKMHIAIADEHGLRQVFLSKITYYAP